MAYNPANPVIIQSDKSVLLEVDNDHYEKARDALARFAELEKSPEHIHTYRLTPLSLWNAAASGMTAERIIDALHKYAKYDVPGNVIVDITDYVSRYGRLKLIRDDSGRDLLLVSDDPALIAQVNNHKTLQKFVIEPLGSTTLKVDPARRGHIKQALVRFGFPAEDLAGYVDGAHLPLNLLTWTRSNAAFTLRHYQQEAADIFYADGQAHGGSGTIVLPCGAGKTMVGMAAMAKLQVNTLILTPSTVAARQWKAELLDKTDLREQDIGEYTGLAKEIRPVTIATYQILVYRKSRTQPFKHFDLFQKRDWGLIIYDEVHLLPAPVFRFTAEIQARRRLGLTATLVREDGLEEDVFSLIGPKKYDVPWKDLERQGWIATAECHEIRIPLPEDHRMIYAMATKREKITIAANNPDKIPILRDLLKKHHQDTILVIGTYLEQLKTIARQFDLPLITGKTGVKKREELFEKLRKGEICTLVISKVGNFSIDLPDVSVAVQISGTFGSRQEEAQRLGRILRPKHNGLIAHFYTLVSRDTREQDFAAKRQLFLTEQGYHYDILYDDEIAAYQPTLLSLQAQEKQYLLTAD